LDSPFDVSFQAHSTKCVECLDYAWLSHLSVLMQPVLVRVVLVLPEVLLRVSLLIVPALFVTTCFGTRLLVHCCLTVVVQRSFPLLLQAAWDLVLVLLAPPLAVIMPSRRAVGSSMICVSCRARTRRTRRTIFCAVSDRCFHDICRL
jgi:hypothetical protein